MLSQKKMNKKETLFLLFAFSVGSETTPDFWTLKFIEILSSFSFPDISDLTLLKSPGELGEDASEQTDSV